MADETSNQEQKERQPLKPKTKIILILVFIVGFLSIAHMMWVHYYDYSIETSFVRYTESVEKEIEGRILALIKSDGYAKDERDRLESLLPQLYDSDILHEMCWKEGVAGLFKYVNFFCWDISELSERPDLFRPIWKLQVEADNKEKKIRDKWRKEREEKKEKRRAQILNSVEQWNKLLQS